METSFNFYHETPVQIRFNDLDMLAHVNNATIQEYFDLGRMHYLNQVFNHKLYEDGLALIIASINSDFYMPIFLNDEIKVQTKVYELGNKSLKMVQQIIGSNGHLKANCKSIMVCYKKETNETHALPDSWKEKFKLVEKNDLR